MASTSTGQLRASVTHQTFPSLTAAWYEFPEHMLILVEQGTLLLEVGTVEWRVLPQHAAWVHADTPVSLSAAREVGLASIRYERTAVTWPHEPCRVFALSPAAIALLKQVADHADEADLLGLADICRSLAQTSDPFWRPRASSPELKAALTFIDEHLGQTLTFDDICAHTALAPNTLTRRFIDELGMGWQDYLAQARLFQGDHFKITNPCSAAHRINSD